MKLSLKSKKKKALKPPSEVIAICENPGYVDHLVPIGSAQSFRISVEVYDGMSHQWKLLAQDEGSEIWLLEYPPKSRIVHYSMQA